jgi:hypothetical protein
MQVIKRIAGVLLRGRLFFAYASLCRNELEAELRRFLLHGFDLLPKVHTAFDIH